MKSVIISMLLLLGGFIVLSTSDASAYVCARGVYRAGCVGVPQQLAAPLLSTSAVG